MSKPKDQTDPNQTPTEEIKEPAAAAPKDAPKKESKKKTKKPAREEKQTDASTTGEEAAKATAALNIKENIKVDIRNRKEQFFQGEAKTVSSLNDTGEFDVLPQHANFVTLIRGYVIIDKGMPTEKKFEVDNGVLAAKTGAVDVYLDF